jgi:hypothetical protein
MGGRGYQSRIESLTARMAAALVQLRHLRAEVSVVAVVPGHDDRSRFRENIDKITKTLTLPEPAVTPAEARTGISDRDAAALADLANLRYGLKAGDVDWTPELDRIEQALRAHGAA